MVHIIFIAREINKRVPRVHSETARRLLTIKNGITRRRVNEREFCLKTDAGAFETETKHLTAKPCTTNRNAALRCALRRRNEPRATKIWIQNISTNRAQTRRSRERPRTKSGVTNTLTVGRAVKLSVGDNSVYSICW